MDKSLIIAGGVGLGVLLLALGRSSQAQPNAGTAALQTVYAGSAARDLAAPSIIAAAGSVQNQQKQIEVAGSNAFASSTYDFMSKLADTGTKSSANTLNFALASGANYREYLIGSHALTNQNEADIRKHQTARLGIQSNERLQSQKDQIDQNIAAQSIEANRQIQSQGIAANEHVSIHGQDTGLQIAFKQADTQVALGQLQADLQKKALDNNFWDSIIQGVAGGLNPAQSVISGGGLTGSSGGAMGGGYGGNGAMNSQALSQLVGMLSSLLGGSSGSTLSSTGGGAGQNSSGGGSALSSIIPIALALL